jgi:hypothetical protein
MWDLDCSALAALDKLKAKIGIADGDQPKPPPSLKTPKEEKLAEINGRLAALFDYP